MVGCRGIRWIFQAHATCCHHEVSRRRIEVSRTDQTFNRNRERHVGHDEDIDRIVFGPVDASCAADDLDQLAFQNVPADSLCNGVRVPVGFGWPNVPSAIS